VGKTVLLDVRLFTGGADLTGDSNRVEVAVETEEKPTTNYGSGGWTELLGGLASATVQAGGQWTAGDPAAVDETSWQDLGGRGAWTICPLASTVGALAYTTRALRSTYSHGGAVGDVAPWTASAKSTWPLVRGQVAHPPGTPRTASGVGAALNLGPVAARQRLYAAVHVLSAAGTTPELTVSVEADSEEAFGDDPATVLAFSTVGEPGGQILRTIGDPIAGPWYRLTFDVDGGSPSFLFAAALGIY
jgi:hypothetical protein